MQLIILCGWKNCRVNTIGLSVKHISFKPTLPRKSKHRFQARDRDMYSDSDSESDSDEPFRFDECAEWFDDIPSFDQHWNRNQVHRTKPRKPVSDLVSYLSSKPRLDKRRTGPTILPCQSSKGQMPKEKRTQGKKSFAEVVMSHAWQEDERTARIQFGHKFPWCMAYDPYNREAMPCPRCQDNCNVQHAASTAFSSPRQSEDISAKQPSGVTSIGPAESVTRQWRRPLWGTSALRKQIAEWGEVTDAWLW